jgi:hypothetical protein
MRGLNVPKQGSNMYNMFYTLNQITGCDHRCKYCYLKEIPGYVWEYALHEDRFGDPGTDKQIFLGSACDMLGKGVPREWLLRILEWCNNHSNWYLIQSKNIGRIIEDDLFYLLPYGITLGTTLETSDSALAESVSKAPNVLERIRAMKELRSLIHEGRDTYRNTKLMLSLEPLMDFNVSTTVMIIKDIRPDYVSIGADSKEHHLKEPVPIKVLNLIEDLSYSGVTQVRIKPNLHRLVRGYYVPDGFKKFYKFWGAVEG